MPAALPAAAQPAKTGGTLTVGLDGEIDTIDPLKSVTIVGFQVYTQMYEGLVAANRARSMASCRAWPNRGTSRRTA